ncbi:class I SAM-dependent methyltransferase [Heyndrickxia acidicola]|uniref:Class I SAM-dependent methyltransferase n=1 Tax=Heyndrickxia acidicola TaxID=209389 RepID=A0ABU6MEP7_9BACI|nr:class I SAM-dependent methyltransferase [Heyndrickxia acidicola]MED1203123.1 class I SAM-dependent methyltransferase [Heyndrickxia acidicola]
MKLQRIIPFAHQLLQSALTTGDIAVDCTAGNGHDTLFLAKLVEERGHVFGFDIQREAILQTEKRLKEENIANATLFNQGHETIQKAIPETAKGKVKGAIFNLGYLPGGDKHIVTHASSTMEAIEQLLDFMPSEGLIVVVIYHGHPEGQEEKNALMDYLSQLDQKKAHVLLYQFINQANDPPFIIAIEKR